MTYLFKPPPFWQIVTWTLRATTGGISSASLEIGFATSKGSLLCSVSGKLVVCKNGSTSDCTRIGR